MADDWYMEGEWFKNCNCDPGCPCDFNQAPTHDNCEGLVAMRITKGHFGDVELDGLCWAGSVQWPGRMDEGDGAIQAFIDERANDQQRQAILAAISGQSGDTLFEIIAAVCPNVADPISAPFEWSFDLDNRRGRVKIGNYIETEVESLVGFGDPPPPYQIQVRIPNGFEYTGPDHVGETALAKSLRVGGAINFDHSDCHSSMALVRHGPSIGSGAEPVVTGGDDI
jgi:hypothetical protein